MPVFDGRVLIEQCVLVNPAVKYCELLALVNVD